MQEELPSHGTCHCVGDSLPEEYWEMAGLPVGALRSFPVPAAELADSDIFLSVTQLGKAFLMLQRQEFLHKARSPRGNRF